MKNHQIKIKLSRNKPLGSDDSYKIEQITGAITVEIERPAPRTGNNTFMVGSNLTEAQAKTLAEHRFHLVTVIRGDNV
jgi:hypothetical protein